MNLKHGHYIDGIPSPTYESWSRMKQRCDDKNHPKYHLYGGRGISYDPAWSDFVSFLSDMGERPDETTLDRKNRDEGYNKDNCRWSSIHEQNRNRITTVLTLNDAVNICMDLMNGEKQKDVGAKYSVSRECISSIWRSRTWEEAYEIAQSEYPNRRAAGNTCVEG